LAGKILNSTFTFNFSILTGHVLPVQPALAMEHVHFLYSKFIILKFSSTSHTFQIIKI